MSELHDAPAAGDSPDGFAVDGERFRLLVESVRDYAIFLLDREGRVRTWNAGAQRIKGYARDEIVGQHFSRFYPQEAIARGWPQYELVEAARVGRFEDEGWRLRKDGSRFWANVVITALRDETGELQGFAKVTRDLTERRAHEEALRRSEERFRLVVDAVVDYAIFMLDANGRILTWNTGGQRIYGYSANEVIGRHFSSFYPEDAVSIGWPGHELDAAVEHGRFEDEGWRLRKDGSRFWANVVITPLRDSAGNLHGFAKVTRDLSERLRAEEMAADGATREALLEAERNARIEAQRAARMKDEFLTTLSHELRTPLNSILGWAQILQRHQSITAEDIQRGAEAIERNARAQAQLVNDLLDLNRIITGRIRLDIQRLMPDQVVRAAIESMEPAAAAKRIRLEADLQPLAGPISGDPVRLQQVAWNLLSNAIKFTPRDGRVEVSVRRVDSHVEIRVSDTGMGIPHAFLPHLFERFSQHDSSIGRAHGGLGLGLAIAKQLVELHGGTIAAQSGGPGLGATFIVCLPLPALLEPTAGTTLAEAARKPASANPDTLPRLDGVRVLVVDDEADARDLMKRVLEQSGATVNIAASGEDALMLLRNDPPNVLVSDIGMPRMDGYQLMRTIRAAGDENAGIPALALTAFARGEDRKRALMAGYQWHLAKPVEIAELVLAVAALTGRRSEPPPAPAPK